MKYRITAEIIPYEEAGVDSHGEMVTEPAKADKAEFDGHFYVMVEEDAIVLSEESKVIGQEQDPQDLRMDSGLGRMETKRVEGQLADIHVGAGNDTAPPPEWANKNEPPVIVTEPVLPKTSGPTEAEIEAADRAEKQSWEGARADEDFEKAIGFGEPLKGRVTVVGTGAKRKR